MKSWQQKFNNGKPAQVKVLEKAFGGYPIGTTMYISTPAEIDEFIHSLDVGQSISVSEMRDILAKANNAEFTCALTTGIFLRIVTERAYEQYVENEQSDPSTNITPFWRVVEPCSKLADKLSFDKQFILTMRKVEKVA